MKAGKPIVGLVCGLVFALGLGVSGMTQPSKVLGFLDVGGGAWDPSLAFVMIGGMLTIALVRRIAPARPLFDAAYPTLARAPIDRPLVIGAAVFGLGWGLVGYCPGPAFVSLGAFIPGAGLFCAAVLLGMAIFETARRRIYKLET
ncbi:MAG TPA: DUF6691 family protein [Polyangia bacterium]|jgi:hypothetical protein